MKILVVCRISLTERGHDEADVFCVKKMGIARYLSNVFCFLMLIMIALEVIGYRVFLTYPYNMNKLQVMLPNPISRFSSITESRDNNSSCPDVATGMMRGTWKSRHLTAREKKEVETFLKDVRNDRGIPNSLQRSDGKCGNISYEKLFWYRALCNPEGPTPCCYDGRCVSKSSDECRCPKCYDLRTQIHAEYSTWEPVDSRCQVKNFTASDACNLLQGTQLIVVGDSLMRHLYTALLLVLSNNGFDGALDAKIPKQIHDQCTGMYMFTEKICRNQIRRYATFCNGKTFVSLKYYWIIAHKNRFYTLVEKLLHKPRSVIVVSIGPHENYKRSIYSEFLQPALAMIKENESMWPRIIWATTHKFGILKTPNVRQQEWEKVQDFNDFMSEKLQLHKIPIFDTFNLTDGVVSPDSAHFGLGVNVMKVQLLMNFLQELKLKEQW